MERSNRLGFSPGVSKWLKHYVYRLIDPRDGQTFYVGMGQGNRVFSHYNDVLADRSDPSDKAELISDLLDLNLRPGHIIHRHGLTEDEARLVERVLIQSYRGLTNIARPGRERGPAAATQLDRRYSRETVPIDGYAIRITIRRHVLEQEHDGDLYEATRRAWKVGKQRLHQINRHAHHVLTMLEGRCVEVYRVPVSGWTECEKYSTPERRRYKFTGALASADVRERYVDRPFDTSQFPLRYCGGFKAPPVERRSHFFR